MKGFSKRLVLPALVTLIVLGTLTPSASAWWKYRVKSGDSLAKVVRIHTGLDYRGYVSFRKEILRRNPILRGNDNLIKTGWELWLPDGPVQERQARERAERERKRQEQIRRANEEKRRQELQRRQREEAARRQREAEEHRKREEAARRQREAEERRRREEEAKRQQELLKKQQEEARRQREAKEARRQRETEEQKKHEEDINMLEQLKYNLLSGNRNLNAEASNVNEKKELETHETDIIQE